MKTSYALMAAVLCALPVSAAVTSAGVYDSNGVLVRTLWSNSPDDPVAEWNGIDDEGVLRPDGQYELRVLTSNVQYTWDGVLGNNSESFTSTTFHRALDTMFGMAVWDSTLYVAAGYNEQITASFKTSTSNTRSRSNILDKGAIATHVTTDGTNVYWAARDHFIAENSFVYVTRVSDDAEAVLAQAVPRTATYGRTYTSAIDAANGTGTFITGLAVQVSGPFLFVSRAALNRLDVLDKSTGELINMLTYPSPGALATDRSGHLWMVMGTTAVMKYEVKEDGMLDPVASISAGLSKPLALAVSQDETKLFIADGGTAQHVKVYDNGGTGELPLQSTIGRPGGYANGPNVTDEKFFFRNTSRMTLGSDASGVGADWAYLASEPDGSLWIGDPANVRAQRFDAAGHFVDRIQYLPAFYNMNVDANDATRLFASFLEFHVDYSKPLAPDNGSWTLAKNWAWGVPAAYQDMLLNLKSVTTFPNGRTYALSRKGAESRMAVVELPANGKLRVTGIEVPSLSYSIDASGNLRSVVPYRANPVVWRKQTLFGTDSSNNPVWETTPTPVVMSPHLKPNDACMRGTHPWEVTSSGVVLAFDDFSDTYGWHLQGLDVATGEWKWKAAPSTNVVYSGPYPNDGAFDVGNNNFSFYAGGGNHAIGRHVFWQYHGEGWKDGQTNVWTHLYDDGLVVGQFGVAGPSWYLAQGTPGMAGNAFASAVVSAPDGSIYIYHNDEAWHGGMHRWHVTGLDTVSEQTSALTLDTHSSPDLRVTHPYDGMTRWMGFIQPEHSETYTFHTTAMAGTRLFVAGELIIDQWQGAPVAEWTGTIALEAGKWYPIRLEYNSTSCDASADLSWSSASRTKEIIPPSRLKFVDVRPSVNGTDLGDGLVYMDSVRDSLYGWHRNPVDDDRTNRLSQWWVVDTNAYSWRRDLPADIRASFDRPGTATVSRDLLPPDAAPRDSWALSGRITFGNTANIREPGQAQSTGAYLRILDDGGKIIARLNPVILDPRAKIMGNTAVLSDIPLSQWGATVAGVPRKFSMGAAGGQITFSLERGETLTTPVFDPASHWRKPRTMELYFWQSGLTYPLMVDLAGLTFSSP
jgi:hypothetical protein